MTGRMMHLRLGDEWLVDMISTSCVSVSEVITFSMPNAWSISS